MSKSRTYHISEYIINATIALICIAILIIVFLWFGLAIRPSGDTLVHEGTVVSSYNDIITVKSMVDDSPSRNNYISISVNENNVLTFRPVREHHYPAKAFEENIAIINEELRSDFYRAYIFDWGIIYSVDNGETFAGAAKHDYEEKYEQNSDFRVIVDTFKLDLFKTNY